MSLKRSLFLSLLMMCVVVLGIAFSTAEVSNAQPPFASSSWNAAFYTNTNFSGAPVANVAYTSLNLNWGGVPTQQDGQPVPGFTLSDNFSVRFTKTVTLSAGVYNYTMLADDRATLSINGVPIINITSAGGQASQQIQIQTGGPANLQVDFIEFADTARLVLQEPGGTTPTNPFQPTSTSTVTAQPTRTPLPAIPAGAQTATVIRAGVLNVRDAPSLGGNRLGRILRGETYAVLGRDSDARWFLLQLGGYQAWAYGYYLYVDGNEFNPPIVSGNSVLGLAGQADYGVRGQTDAILRLRAEPNVASMQTGRITWGAFLPIIGRTADGYWYRVVWRGTVGWAYSSFINITEGDLNNVPIY